MGRPADSAVAIVIALGVTGFIVLYFLPAILAVILRRRAARAIGLLAGWMIIGWFASLYLVWAWRNNSLPGLLDLGS